MPSSRANEPWDVDAAEALTCLFESGEGDPRKRQDGGDAKAEPARADVMPAPVGASERDGTWLEARLGEIAARLQSVTELGPDKSLSALNGRFDQLEERFTDALQHVALRSDVEGLRLIEAHVTDLTGHIEDARSQLARLDTIDGHVRDLARRLEAGDQQRLDPLEGLLQDYIAEWRRGEEQTASVLHTIEDALGRIADRVEAIEASNPAPQSSLSAFDAFNAPERPNPRLERDPLTVAASEGARALAPKCYRATLDAADYVPSTPKAAASEGATAAAGPLEAAPAPARGDFQASAMRARLKAEALSGEPPSLAMQPAGTKTAAAGHARAQSSPTGGPRPGLLLAAAMALLAGGGFLLVDVLMSKPMPPQARSGTVQIEQGAATQPLGAKPGLAEPRMQTSEPQPSSQAGKPDADPRPDAQEDATAPPSAPPRRPHVPETVTDDLSDNAPPPHAAGGAQAPRAQPAAAVQHEPQAFDNNQPATLRAMLPATIGPASLRQAAAGGEPAAQFEIAARYAEGRGVEQDFGQATAWYQRAAMRGFAPAQFRLAMLYERGMGLAADAERARVWYTRAAEQGHVKAMHNLAVLSAGSRSDAATAAKWFTAAAELGLTDSQFNLAVFYLNGQGVARNLQAAYKWFALAARSGDKEAARRLEQVRAQLPSAEAEAAEAMVKAWRAQTPEQKVNDLPGAARAIGE